MKPKYGIRGFLARFGLALFSDVLEEREMRLVRQEDAHTYFLETVRLAQVLESLQGDEE